MSDTWTDEWRKVCLEALCEVEPERRIAIVEKLGRIARKERHEFGTLWVDFTRGEVRRNGTILSLTNLELRLLRYLLERVGNPVSRGELLRAVWSYRSGAYTRTVDMHISGLRQKIEEDAKQPQLIVTVKGVGYKFVVQERPATHNFVPRVA
jgi:two-component system, OmpR family, alkaline phosphatase synthesis response regulator PhoP